MQLKPVAGRQVPDPDKGGYLPVEGRNVQPSVYWYRRIADGDVVEIKTKATSSKTPKPTSKSKGADK